MSEDAKIAISDWTHAAVRIRKDETKDDVRVRVRRIIRGLTVAQRRALINRDASEGIHCKWNTFEGLRRRRLVFRANARSFGWSARTSLTLLGALVARIIDDEEGIIR